MGAIETQQSVADIERQISDIADLASDLDKRGALVVPGGEEGKRVHKRHHSFSTAAGHSTSLGVHSARKRAGSFSVGTSTGHNRLPSKNKTDGGTDSGCASPRDPGKTRAPGGKRRKSDEATSPEEVTGSGAAAEVAGQGEFAVESEDAGDELAQVDGSSMEFPQMVAADNVQAVSAQHWSQVPMMASSPYCLSFDAASLAGQGLAGLCLEAEVPLAAAAFFGFTQYQAYNFGGFANQVQPSNMGAAYGAGGQDVFHYGGLENSGYQVAQDFAPMMGVKMGRHRVHRPMSRRLAGRTPRSQNCRTLVSRLPEV